jgi:hypothetical protein
VKDPTTGAPYFYNQSTGVSQWDRPDSVVNIMQHQVSPSLPENWEEAIDKSTGRTAKTYNLSHTWLIFISPELSKVPKIETSRTPDARRETGQTLSYK